MCRSIKILRTPGAPTSESDILEVSLQFVRKISGYRHQSQPNQAAFEQAVNDIAAAASVLLSSLKQRLPAGSR